MARTLTSSSLRRCIGLALLALGPAVAIAGGTTPADFLVQDLPGLNKDDPQIKMHAGHIEVSPDTNGNLFFWHFENNHVVDRQRTVIWLNGGPGCSSEDGALMEIGPYRVKDDKLLPNDGSWNEFANLLFVDNPVGTGYSYVDTNSFIHELDTMADHFVIFLEKYFKIFPDAELHDLYIAGESYAGQHIPYIAKAILARNKEATKNKWNLKGLLIGNGWISPDVQYDAYIDFALEKNIIEENSEVHLRLEDKLHNCKVKMSTDPGHVDYGNCEGILSDLLRDTQKSGDSEHACINMYDVRLDDAFPSCGMNWPPDLNYVEPYLRRDDVIRALHVNKERNTGWVECNGAVGSAFNALKSKPSVKYLPDILKEVPLLLFSGAEDLICNHLGTERLIEELTWNGAKGFGSEGSDAPKRNWTVEGEVAGYWQEARNLTYVLFHDSSHMVPFDFPRRSRDMLDRFLGIDFESISHSRVESQLDGDKPHKGATESKKPQHDSATDKDKSKEVDDAKWAAYRRSGEIVLAIVVVGALVWGFFIWRDRRKRALYRAVNPEEPMGRSRFGADRSKPNSGPGDLEAGAFDESELDDLHADTPTAAGGSKYALDDDSDGDDLYEKSTTGQGRGYREGSGSRQ